jgi:hypothetical protein
MTLNNWPHWLNMICSLKFTCSWTFLCFIYHMMFKVMLEIVVASPKVGVYFCSNLYIFKDYLRQCIYCSILDPNCPHVLTSSFVKSKHPNFTAVVSYFCENRFVNLNTSSCNPKLKFPVLILCPCMDLMSSIFI